MDINDELLEKFTPRARQVITEAQELANSVVTPVHFLFSLLDNGGRGIWREALESIGIEPETIRLRAAGAPIFFPARMSGEENLSQPDSAGERVIELSLREAERLGDTRAGCEALLLGLIGQGGERAGGILIGAGADLGRTRREVDRLLGGRIVLSSARNLTQAAIDGELDPVIGRDREIDRLLHVLFRSSSNIPMLVGRTGVGKTSVVYGLAQRIAANKVPEAFAGIQVFQLNVRTAVQRAKTRDEFDGLISRMLPENLTWRDALLFLDDEQLLQFPLPVKLRIIGATKKSHMLSGIFIPIAVEEISVQQTIQILESRRDRIQERYQVIVADRALEAVAQYAKERLDGPLPGSAFDLLDEAASLGYVRGLGLIDEMTVAEAVAGMLGVAPERVKTAPRVRAPTGRVEHDPEIWEMS